MSSMKRKPRTRETPMLLSMPSSGLCAWECPDSVILSSSAACRDSLAPAIRACSPSGMMTARAVPVTNY